jgi:molybdopterin converting factor small subunit
MKLYLGSYFAFFTPDRRHWVELDLPHPARLADVLSELGVPAAEVHLVVVNDQAGESTDLLVSNGDIVRLFPPAGGG